MTAAKSSSTVLRCLCLTTLVISLPPPPLHPPPLHRSPVRPLLPSFAGIMQMSKESQIYLKDRIERLVRRMPLPLAPQHGANAHLDASHGEEDGELNGRSDDGSDGEQCAPSALSPVSPAAPTSDDRATMQLKAPPFAPSAPTASLRFAFGDGAQLACTEAFAKWPTTLRPMCNAAAAA